jgi:hypothetical protein
VLADCGRHHFDVVNWGDIKKLMPVVFELNPEAYIITVEDAFPRMGGQHFCDYSRGVSNAATKEDELGIELLCCNVIIIAH